MESYAEILKALKQKDEAPVLKKANGNNAEAYEIRMKLMKILYNEVSSMPLNNDLTRYKYVYKIFKYLSHPYSNEEKEEMIDILEDCSLLCQKRMKSARTTKNNKNNIKVLQKIKDIIDVTIIDLDFYNAQDNKPQVSFKLLMYLIFEVKNYNYLYEIIRSHPDKIIAKNDKGKYLIEELIDIYLDEVVKNTNQGQVIYLEKVIKLFIDNPKLKLEDNDINLINDKLNNYIKEIDNIAINQDHKRKIIFFINEVMNYIDKNVYTSEQLLELSYVTFDSLKLGNLQEQDKELILEYFSYLVKVVNDNVYSIEIIQKLNDYTALFAKTKIKRNYKAKINDLNNILIKYLNGLNIQYRLFDYLDYKYDVNASVSPDIVDEISKITWDNNEEILDCRDKFTVTIDGERTQIFDDAISLESFEDGGFLLGIYLADAASFVKPESQIDTRAYNLGETIYLPDRYIPMLPPDLVHTLTLKESEDKRVIGNFFLFDKDMNLIRYSVNKCLINVDKNFSYDMANSYLTDSRDLAEIKILRNMLVVSNRISKLGISKEYLEIKNLKRKILDESAAVDTLASNMIINFMVYINNYIANFFCEHPEIPFIYRNNLVNYSDTVLRRINEMAREDYSFKDAVSYLNVVCPPSFYSTVNQGHNGLMVNAYCNSTNPLRDYCSLEIQRLIEKYMIRKDFQVDEGELERLKKLSEYLNSRKLMNCEYRNEMLDLRDKIMQLTI